MATANKKQESFELQKTMSLSIKPKLNAIIGLIFDTKDLKEAEMNK